MKKAEQANALIKRQLAEGDKESGKLLLSLTAMGHSASFKDRRNDDPDKLAQREEIRKIVREDPQMAFAIVALPEERTELTPQGAADVLDAIIGVIGDPDVAREHLNATVNPDRQVELLRARGDLPSSAAEVVDLEVVLSTVFEDIASWDPKEDFEQIFWLQAWARKLKDRSDWKDFLEMPVGLLTVEHLLCLAVAIEARGQHKEGWEIEDIEPDLFDSVGLEYDDSLDILRELGDKHMLFPEIDSLELERIRRHMGEQVAAAQGAPKTTSEAAAAAATSAAEDDAFKF